MTKAPELPNEIASLADGAPSSRRLAWQALALFVLLLAAYIPSWEALWSMDPDWTPQGLYSRDALGNRLVASLLSQGKSLDLTPFLAGEQNNRLLFEQMAHRSDEVIYPRFPIATAVMAAPIFGVVAPFHLGLPQRELIAAALMTAMACVFFFLLLARLPELRGTPWLAFLLALGLGLATPFFASNSQALWSHTGSALWICVFLWIVWDRDLTPRRLAAAGAVLALAACCRPSQLFPLAIAGALLAWEALKNQKALSLGVDASSSKQANYCGSDNVGNSVKSRSLDNNCNPITFRSVGVFCIAAAVPLLIMSGIHIALYGEPLGPYLRQLMDLGAGSGDALASSSMSTALVGALISPSAGLFVFCPMALLALGGGHWAWQRGNGQSNVGECESDESQEHGLGGIWGRWTLLCVVIQWLLIARNPLWWGGWCWGPRLFADSMPLIILLSVPVAAQMARQRKTWIIVVTLLLGTFLQGLGVTSYQYAWHMLRASLDDDPTRLWTFNDGIIVQTMRDSRPGVFVEEWPTLDDMLLEEAERMPIEKAPIGEDFTGNAGVGEPAEALSTSTHRVRFQGDSYNVAMGLMSNLSIVGGTPCRGFFLEGTNSWYPVPAGLMMNLGKRDVDANARDKAGENSAGEPGLETPNRILWVVSPVFFPIPDTASFAPSSAATPNRPRYVWFNGGEAFPKRLTQEEVAGLPLGNEISQGSDVWDLTDWLNVDATSIQSRELIGLRRPARPTTADITILPEVFGAELPYFLVISGD